MVLPQPKEETIGIPSSIRVKDLARLLNLPVTRVIKELMQNNIFSTINEEIDHETAAIIAEDLGFKTKFQDDSVTDEQTAQDSVATLGKIEQAQIKPRPPVVAIMGHVDHGKTTLLDYMRKANIAQEETGGITQNIGAYQVVHKGKKITFLDTPGHEAFATMRERGSHLTDIAILVIAADDGIKPQTKEAIKHIQRAKIPMIVAINKMDKPGAKPDQIKSDLAQEGVYVEKWGGNVPVQEISAVTGQGVDHLLDVIQLVAEMEALKAPREKPILGTVIEAHLSAQRGAEATVLVQSGRLKLGDRIGNSETAGKVKRMEDFRGQAIKEAGPSTPVKVIGLPQPPAIGSVLQAIQEGRGKKTMMMTPREIKALKEINDRALNPKIKKLNLIIKTDTHGSKEAILENLSKIKSAEVAPYIITAGIGKITESDVLKGHITHAILIGFKAEMTKTAQALSKQLGTQVYNYALIYELMDKIKKGLEAMLKPQTQKIKLGELSVLAVFRTERGKMIVGGKVTQGKAVSGVKIQVQRQGEVLGEGEAGELQTGKQKVAEVKTGQEAGIKFLGEVKIEKGDTLEFYKVETKKQVLE